MEFALVERLLFLNWGLLIYLVDSRLVILWRKNYSKKRPLLIYIDAWCIDSPHISMCCLCFWVVQYSNCYSESYENLKSVMILQSYAWPKELSRLQKKYCLLNRNLWFFHMSGRYLNTYRMSCYRCHMQLFFMVRWLKNKGLKHFGSVSRERWHIFLLRILKFFMIGLISDRFVVLMNILDGIRIRKSQDIMLLLSYKRWLLTIKQR